MESHRRTPPAFVDARRGDGLRQQGAMGGGSVAGKDKETAAGLKAPALHLNRNAFAIACGSKVLGGEKKFCGCLRQRGTKVNESATVSHVL